MKRPRIKRLLLLLLAYAVGGAIINVAVAWGCAIWSDPTVTFEIVRAEAEPLLVQRGVSILHDDYLLANGVRGPGLTMSQFALDASSRQGTSLWCVTTTAGLPCRSLDGELLGRGATRDEVFRFKYLGAMRIPDSIREPKTFPWLLPYRPLWPGFAINTIFYAAILWLLFAAPGWVRRRIRARRGQCPACAYPVGASNVCTECGRPVRRNE